MKPVIDHVQITVRDLDAVTPICCGLMRIPGFKVEKEVSATMEEHEFRVVQYTHPHC